MTEYFDSLLRLLNEMSPYLLLGFFMSGLLHSFVPQSVYSRHLSGNGFRASIKAALIGIPLPLCSCGVIPTTVALRKNGASKAASTSFLIATPQTGVDSIAATYSLLGLPFAIIRPLVALVTAIIGGKLVGLFGGKTDTPMAGEYADDNCSCGDDCVSSGKGFFSKLLDAVDYGFVRIMQDVGRWLVAGLLIAALITVAVPDGFFARFADQPFLNMVIVLCVAVPMYICATGSIPVALSLMIKGMSPGAALVLLMAGPATNVMSILVIGRVFGRKSLLLYLSSIILGAVGFGLVMDYFLPQEWFTRQIADISAAGCCADECSACGEGIDWFGSLCSSVFVALLVWSYVKLYFGSRKNKQKVDKCMKKEFKIKGMMCNHCKANVETNLAKVAGVESVTVDLAAGKAYLEGDFNADEVVAMIRSLGYEYVE